MATIAIVRVLLTKFTKLIDGREGRELADYLWGCLTDGMAAVLYENPHILTAFYTEGNDAWDALDLAIRNWQAAPTENNLNIVKDKMALAVLWLRSYAAQVQVIANLPANCTTREEARTNIGLSFLTAQKLSNTSKGDPVTPEVTGKNLSTGKAQIKIINTIDFDPRCSIFILVSKAPLTEPHTDDAIVELDEKGQIKISAAYDVEVFMIHLDGKGRTANFQGLTPAWGYDGYCFSKNGNKNISELSEPVVVYG